MEEIISQGLPQGDVLSPMLFNLYTTKLHDKIQTKVVSIQFADNFSKIVRGQTREEAIIKAQMEIDKFASMCSHLSLLLNEAKTKAKLFTVANIDLQLKLGGTPIETVRNYNYLGIHVDKTLSYGTHIRTMKRRISD